MNNPKILKIASIVIGVFIAILLLVLGFNIFQSVFTRAADYEPRDVVITDIAQNSVKIGWTTGVDSQGVIEYGTTTTALNFFAPEPQKTKTHSVDLTLLSPGSTYYFQIRIGDQKYDNGGVPWTFTTKGADQSVASPTAVPTQAPVAVSPTPIQTLDIPAAPGTVVCNETDCTKIKAKLGKGCSTQDYFKCIRKLTPTPTPTP